MRHFFASGLIYHNADVVTVQRALGHQSATVTLNTYSHLWPSAADRAREASAHMMRAALSSGAAPPFSVGLVMDGPPLDLSQWPLDGPGDQEQGSPGPGDGSDGLSAD